MSSDFYDTSQSHKWTKTVTATQVIQNNVGHYQLTSDLFHTVFPTSKCWDCKSTAVCITRHMNHWHHQCEKQYSINFPNTMWGEGWAGEREEGGGTWEGGRGMGLLFFNSFMPTIVQTIHFDEVEWWGAIDIVGWVRVFRLDAWLCGRLSQVLVIVHQALVIKDGVEPIVVVFCQSGQCHEGVVNSLHRQRKKKKEWEKTLT